MTDADTDPADERSRAAFQREVLLFDEWRRQFERDGEAQAIPAATVVVLRDGPGGMESLMLRKNSRIAFGGMWVFPGGRIDDADHDGTGDLIAAARNAAAREAHEEATVVLAPEQLVHFSYWIPPPIAPKRFATWFFAAEAPDGEVAIDEGEITHHEWMTAADAMCRRDAGRGRVDRPDLGHLAHRRALRHGRGGSRRTEPTPTAALRDPHRQRRAGAGVLVAR